MYPSALMVSINYRHWFMGKVSRACLLCLRKQMSPWWLYTCHGSSNGPGQVRVILQWSLSEEKWKCTWERPLRKKSTSVQFLCTRSVCPPSVCLCKDSGVSFAHVQLCFDVRLLLLLSSSLQTKFAFCLVIFSQYPLGVCFPLLSLSPSSFLFFVLSLTYSCGTCGKSISEHVLTLLEFWLYELH